MTKASEIKRKWFLVDASGQTLGRLASRVALLLTGKRKPNYVPYLDMGDHVVVINASKIRVTGRKLEQKRYFQYSGYPGGMKSVLLKDQLVKRPTRVVEDAIVGMLPKSKLGKAMARKLRVYADSVHPHTAQKPEALAF